MKLCNFEVGLEHPLFLIAGPCVIESREFAIETAGKLKEIAAKVGIPFIYKSSYDKANRSSTKTFRGFGLEEGLRILDEVRTQIGVPVLTDVHTTEQVPHVAAVVDVLQTPAFLCRQTDFIIAVATCGKPVNIKKGQFLAPHDMLQVVNKAKEANGGACRRACRRRASAERRGAQGSSSSPSASDGPCGRAGLLSARVAPSRCYSGLCSHSNGRPGMQQLPCQPDSGV